MTENEKGGETGQEVAPSTLELPLAGRNLRGATLGAEIASEATLLVFLRHLG